MPIRLATENDAEVWDYYVSQYEGASPYHRFAWKKAIEESYSHKCVYLIAEDDSNNIQGILPTVLIAPPLTSGRLCSLPFCDRGEALTDNPEVKKALIQRAQQVATQNKVIYEYRASSRTTAQNPTNLDQSMKVSMMLELPESSAALLASFKSKLRSQIKKAGKNGLTFDIGQSMNMIDDFYRVFTINMRDLGSPTHSKKWFEQIRQSYQENMIISIVRYEGQPVGAGIVLLNARAAVIPWASTLRKYNHLSPNMLLYWSLLSYVSDHGYRTFDFGRSSYGEGTYKFKQQWGAIPVPLDWKTFARDQVETPALQSQVKGNLRTAVETVWSYLPLSMTVLLGSRIRKYISL